MRTKSSVLFLSVAVLLALLANSSFADRVTFTLPNSQQLMALSSQSYAYAYGEHLDRVNKQKISEDNSKRQMESVLNKSVHRAADAICEFLGFGQAAGSPGYRLSQDEQAQPLQSVRVIDYEEREELVFKEQILPLHKPWKMSRKSGFRNSSEKFSASLLVAISAMWYGVAAGCESRGYHNGLYLGILGGGLLDLVAGFFFGGFQQCRSWFDYALANSKFLEQKGTYESAYVEHKISEEHDVLPHLSFKEDIVCIGDQDVVMSRGLLFVNKDSAASDTDEIKF